MGVDELLLNLQDIQPPPEPAWWLLPPATWFVLGILLLLATGSRWYRRRRARNWQGASARAELERIAARHVADRDDMLLVRSLAGWLKRVALQAFPGQGLERMCGQRWLRFLDHSAGNTHFSRGQGAVFGDAVYLRQVEVDSDALLGLCRKWLARVQPRLTRGRPGC